jgi:3-isopropylmalate/(R)-2-methylmalate dehydratase small subunit
VAALDRSNVDTDQIIPKQFLKRIERSGFGRYLFFDWRFREDGSDNPDFELNQERARGATILLARRNFGCGSSREHAPWALEDFGMRAILAPSFADIFYNNCFKNGLLPVVLDDSLVDQLFDIARESSLELEIDLGSQQVRGPDGWCASFDVDPFRRQLLWEGLDDVGLTLKHEARIAAYEAAMGIGQ